MSDKKYFALRDMLRCANIEIKDTQRIEYPSLEHLAKVERLRGKLEGMHLLIEWMESSYSTKFKVGNYVRSRLSDCNGYTGRVVAINGDRMDIEMCKPSTGSIWKDRCMSAYYVVK